MSVFPTPSTADEDMLLAVADLTNWVGWGATVSQEDTQRATTAIRQATGIVQSAVSPMAQTRRLIRINDDTVTLDGNGADTFRLPDWPVIDITSITEDGLLVDAAAYDWSADHGLVRRTDGSRWTAAWRGLVVVYSHGYDPVPAGAIGVVRSLAARLLAEPDGREVRSEALGGYSVGYAGKGLTGLTTLEEQQLATALDGGASR